MKEDFFARVSDYVTEPEATSTHFWLYRKRTVKYSFERPDVLLDYRKQE